MIKPGFIVGAKPFVIDELFAEVSQTDDNANTIIDELFAEFCAPDTSANSVLDELFAEFSQVDSFYTSRALQFNKSANSQYLPLIFEDF